MDAGAATAGGFIRIRVLQRRADQREAERDKQQDGGNAPHTVIVHPGSEIQAYTGYVMKHVNRFAAIFAIAVASYAQTASDKKSFEFHGKVTAVAADGLTVDGAKVEGWMGAMTMKYKVDDAKVLKTVKVGDEIKATVYKDDYTLHKVEVAPKK